MFEKFEFKFTDEDGFIHTLEISGDSAENPHILLDRFVNFLSRLNYCDEQIDQAVINMSDKFTRKRNKLASKPVLATEQKG